MCTSSNQIRENAIIVKAISRSHREGFDIVIEFSGHPEYVYHHSHNGLLYEILRDGIRLDQLRRWKPTSRSASLSRPCKRQRNTRQSAAVQKLINDINRYLKTREALDRARQRTAA